MITRLRVEQALKALGADERTWVAGSAAIIPEKADDIDIWILKKSDLQKEEWAPAIWSPIEIKEGYPQLTTIVKRLETTVPGVEGFSEPIKLQLMFTTCKFIEEILETFDCSCHAWARNLKGYQMSHPKATLPGSPIVRLTKKLDPDDSYWCDDPECHICSPKKAALGPDFTDTRIKEFTTRYADTTAGMCWLPA